MLEYNQQNTLNNFAVRVVSEECTAVGGYAAKRRTSRTHNVVNVRDAVAYISYPIEEVLSSLKTTDSENRKPYEDKNMAAVMKAKIEKVVCEKINLLQVLVRQWQKFQNLVSSPRYLF